jgi:hypothetical protein
LAVDDLCEARLRQLAAAAVLSAGDMATLRCINDHLQRFEIAAAPGFIPIQNLREPITRVMNQVDLLWSLKRDTIRDAPVSIVSGVFSALSQAFAAFFARQVESSNARLERCHHALLEAQRLEAAVTLVRGMEEGPAKARAVEQLLRGVLR